MKLYRVKEAALENKWPDGSRNIDAGFVSQMVDKDGWLWIRIEQEALQETMYMYKSVATGEEAAWYDREVEEITSGDI